MDCRFIIQITFLFVLFFDDLDGLGPVGLEVSNTFAEPFEKLVDDVRVFLNKRKAGRDCGEPDHRQELYINNLHSCSAGEDIAGWVYKCSVGFTVADKLPLRGFAAEALNLAFSQQAVLFDEEPCIESR